MTLGEHRAMSVAVFGEESPATKFLDEKIAIEGAEAPVLANESQLIFLLLALHRGDAT